MLVLIDIQIYITLTKDDYRSDKVTQVKQHSICFLRSHVLYLGP